MNEQPVPIASHTWQQKDGAINRIIHALQMGCGNKQIRTTFPPVLSVPFSFHRGEKHIDTPRAGAAASAVNRIPSNWKISPTMLSSCRRWWASSTQHNTTHKVATFIYPANEREITYPQSANTSGGGRTTQWLWMATCWGDSYAHGCIP